MDNVGVILAIWLFVFLLSGITESNKGEYDYPSPKWLKKIGNPFEGQKKILLSMALLRVCNNIIFIVTVIGHLCRTNAENYWENASVRYIVIMIFLCCISIIFEQIVVIFAKGAKRIGGNIYLICFFLFGSIFMAYMYYKFLN